MLIGGLQKMTLIDYPGKIACTVFTVGCNFRCPFCHNPELVAFATSLRATEGSAAIPPMRNERDCFVPPLAKGGTRNDIISELDFFDFLKSRHGLLGGVCVTGGEPTLHAELSDFLKQIKNLGFSVKLDTNGAAPEKLEILIKDGLVDYIAMDIKNCFKDTYEKTVGVKIDLEKIKKSVKVIMASGLEYEFRTTVVPGLHTEADILDIALEIRGAKKYYLQQFRSGEKILNQEYHSLKPYPAEFLRELREKIKGSFEICEVRE